MAFSSSTVSIGASTKKSDYDRLLDNTKALKDEAITLNGTKTFAGTIIDKNGLEVQGMQMETKVQTGTLTVGVVQDLDVTGFSFTPTAITNVLISVWESIEGEGSSNSTYDTVDNASASYPGNEEWTIHRSRGSSAAASLHAGIGIISLTPGATKVTVRTHPPVGLSTCNYSITVTAVRTA